ncbi:MAG: hypothetical protein QOK39_2085 [Acidimicrobiaceae bacterium]|jgi:hypothetical protein|nr:hypothetical protein [Acidimicrobiaceae bacterium]
MGLARKANVDGVAAGEPGGVDISSILRQAVAAEIERQQQAKADDKKVSEASEE